MKQALLLLPSVLMLLNSCGTAPVQENALLPYIKAFSTTYQVQVYTDVVFVDTMPVEHVVGYCQPNGTVEILKPYWDKTSEAKRQVLMFHELGHCVFNLRHVEAKMPDSCPASIMYPSVVEENCFNRHKSEYIKELRGLANI